MQRILARSLPFAQVIGVVAKCRCAAELLQIGHVVFEFGPVFGNGEFLDLGELDLRLQILLAVLPQCQQVTPLVLFGAGELDAAFQRVEVGAYKQVRKLARPALYWG